MALGAKDTKLLEDLHAIARGEKVTVERENFNEVSLKPTTVEQVIARGVLVALGNK